MCASAPQQIARLDGSQRNNKSAYTSAQRMRRGSPTKRRSKIVAIIDTDLADVSDWDESGKLIFKASAELTPEQKVAVSEIIKSAPARAARSRSSFTTSSQPWGISPSCLACLLIVRKSAGRTADRSR